VRLRVVTPREGWFLSLRDHWRVVGWSRSSPRPLGGCRLPRGGPPRCWWGAALRGCGWPRSGRGGCCRFAITGGWWAGRAVPRAPWVVAVFREGEPPCRGGVPW